jgi:hypothetical protein
MVEEILKTKTQLLNEQLNNLIIKLNDIRDEKINYFNFKINQEEYIQLINILQNWYYLRLFENVNNDVIIACLLVYYYDIKNNSKKKFDTFQKIADKNRIGFGIFKTKAKHYFDAVFKDTIVNKKIENLTKLEVINNLRYYEETAIKNFKNGGYNNIILFLTKKERVDYDKYLEILKKLN